MARKILGKISVEGGIPPGSSLRVLAWDADVDDDDHMGTAQVSEDGFYSIEYRGGDWDWSPFKPAATWRPDIYVVVEWLDPISLMWKQVGRSKVYSNQEMREDREINLSVDLPHTNVSTAYGYVTDVDGKPLQGYTVTAWDEDPSAIRRIEAGEESPALAGGVEREKFLGSAVTAENGEFRIKYAPNPWETTPRWVMREDQGAWWRPDIFIKVHNKDGSGVLHRSPTRQNVINLTGVRIDTKIEEL